MLKSSLGVLMKDFSCRNVGDMYYKILADRVRYFKEDEKGVGSMCKAVEDLCREEKYETTVEIVKRMFALGKLTIEEIENVSGLTLEEVKELAEQN